MVGLHLLKHMNGLSDEGICAVWLEGLYFQVFYGETYFRPPFGRSFLTRGREHIGAEAPEVLLAEAISVPVTDRQLELVTVDATLKTKAVAHPTDSHLMLRATEWLGRLAKRHGIELRQSFVQVMVQTRREAARLIHTGGHKQGLCGLGHRTYDIRRKFACAPDLLRVRRKGLPRQYQRTSQGRTVRARCHGLASPSL